MKLILFLALFCAPAFSQVAHVAGACSHYHNDGSSASGVITFSCTPNAANHAITFQVNCGASAATAVTLSASGWTITPLSGIQGNATVGKSASFGAITPNTSATTFTVTWTSGGTCSGFTENILDEWSGNDTTGGTTTFYANNFNAVTTGGCSGAAVTSTSSNDAVWGACDDNLPTTSWSGAGWTAGGNDLAGSGTEYKIATGAQTPTWTGSSGAGVAMSIAIKAAGGAGTVRHRAWIISR